MEVDGKLPGIITFAAVAGKSVDGKVIFIGLASLPGKLPLTQTKIAEWKVPIVQSMFGITVYFKNHVVGIIMVKVFCAGIMDIIFAQIS